LGAANVNAVTTQNFRHRREVPEQIRILIGIRLNKFAVYQDPSAEEVSIDNPHLRVDVRPAARVKPPAQWWK
jgi:hypothetical protein